MAAAKKKKALQYADKPMNRVGNRIYYGNLEDKFILALDILETEMVGDVETATKVKILLMDNSGELGKGDIYRKAERTNLYKALEIVSWWLEDALASVQG